ncbi:MAG: hypothetical protein CM15mP93_07980 [Thiotrichaceae bacterium]|nr:MAG: hypothetical protein CM15mP93_07980 [Thiotrichaceae bacterium]
MRTKLSITQKNNVKKLVLIGNNLESSQSSLKLAQKYNFISSGLPSA